jgi:ubiquinone/menaquinone biosynthesis C-methylase UbiE
MHYQLAYSIGFHPWEDAATDRPFVDKISELFDREEAGRERPFGPALDLGTGSGIWAVEMAKRGWEVTGIDLVEKALRRARDRVTEAGVDVRLVHGDVTDLRSAGVGSGHRLIVDSGTFHDFDTDQQRAMGREVTAVAAADATLLLIAWPRRRRPLIRGADREEIEQAFPQWSITDVAPSQVTLLKLVEAVLRPDEQWYRLRRSGT